MVFNNLNKICQRMKKLAQYQITINFYNSIGPDDDPKFYHWSDNYTTLSMIFTKFRMDENPGRRIDDQRPNQSLTDKKSKLWTLNLDKQVDSDTDRSEQPGQGYVCDHKLWDRIWTVRFGRTKRGRRIRGRPRDSWLKFPFRSCQETSGLDQWGILNLTPMIFIMILREHMILK